MLMTEDFAVVIEDLPDYHDFNSLNELKARLWVHLEKVIKGQKQVTDHEKLVNSSNTDQIVNIHFGLKSFCKMKILMTIYSEMKQQKREQARMKIDKDPSAKKGYEEMIDKLGKQIDKNIAKYRKYEISH